VITAFQAALAAIWHTPVPDDRPCRQLAALETAVRIGDDTDTVAAIAGGLLGAQWGASAVPTRWRQILHGWPGYHVGDVVRLGILTARAGRTDGAGWPASMDLTDYYRTNWSAEPFAIPLAQDPGVILANIGGVDTVDADVIVSLCRVGREVPVAGERVETCLIDDDGPAANPNLEWVLTDNVEAISRWRGEGKRVAIHCVKAERRTPAVAAAYVARLLNISGTEAWRRVAGQVPGARPNQSFIDALARQWPGPDSAK
jgi:ADP-ribosyl-[dinitrogen reductase] hydrolase